jgi:Ca-activated chloride channel homolog
MNRIVVLAALLMLAMLAGCGERGKAPGGVNGRGATLVIASGSENQALQPVIERYGREHGQNIRMEYLGSVEMMLQLESGALQADAVWPANSLWVELGDQKKQVKHSASIMRSPVVLGVKKSVAEKLGWVGKEVQVQDILDAARSGKLRFMMSSASQSNSGASAYFGYLYAFAGSPEILSQADLQKPKVKEGIKGILSSVDRSAGSSG